MMRQTHPLLLLITFAPAFCILGCRPSGPSEFKAAQQAFQGISHVSVEWSAQTNMGSFKQSAEMDCTALYYHRHLVKDLNAAGVAAGTREALGAPRAHQDTEYLHVGGKSYERSSGAWAFDAKPYWTASAGSYNPKSECQDLQLGKNPEDGPFVPDVHFIPMVDFGRILTENKIEYVAERIVEDGACREYRVVYASSVETSRSATSNGSYSSYEMRPVNATFCIGVKDRLPKEVKQDDWTVKYLYGEIEKLAAP